MLYELIAIVRPGDLGVVKAVVQSTGAYILKNGGVIRGITNWGPFSLPKATSAHQVRHTNGHYVVMQFDSSAKVQAQVRETLRLDPRMIRSAFVRLDKGTLESIKDINGKLDWGLSSASKDAAL